MGKLRDRWRFVVSHPTRVFVGVGADLLGAIWKLVDWWQSADFVAGKLGVGDYPVVRDILAHSGWLILVAVGVVLIRSGINGDGGEERPAVAVRAKRVANTAVFSVCIFAAFVVGRSWPSNYWLRTHAIVLLGARMNTETEVLVAFNADDLKRFSDGHEMLISCRPHDRSLDLLKDPALRSTEPFEIVGGRQERIVAVDRDFLPKASAFGDFQCFAAITDRSDPSKQARMVGRVNSYPRPDAYMPPGQP